MKDVKYSIISRGSMLIQFDNKKTIISGELVFSPPTFYADLKSFKNWEPPYENEKITEIEKNEIIEYISTQSQKEGETKIIFE